MSVTNAPTGFTLDGTVQTLYTNPADSGEIQTVEVRFNNIDPTVGGADQKLNFVRWVDAGPVAKTLNIVPLNTIVGKIDGFTVRKILEPGDSITAQSTNANVIDAVPEITFSEPV